MYYLRYLSRTPRPASKNSSTTTCLALNALGYRQGMWHLELTGIFGDRLILCLALVPAFSWGHLPPKCHGKELWLEDELADRKVGCSRRCLVSTGVVWLLILWNGVSKCISHRGLISGIIWRHPRPRFPIRATRIWQRLSFFFSDFSQRSYRNWPNVDPAGFWSSIHRCTSQMGGN